MTIYGPYPSGLYFTGSAVAPSELVPAVYPVAIAGRPYFIEPKLYRMQHIPQRRPAQEQNAEPGESTINPEGPWRRSQSNWSLGAGQLWLDERGDPNLMRLRFRQSLGIDVFNDYSFKLLPITEQKRSSANTNLKMIRVGTRLYVVDGATLIFSNGSASEQNPQWTTGWTTATGLPGGNILDIAYSGSHVYVLGSDNSIYRATPGTTSFAGPYYNPTAVATRIFTGLGRLFMSDGRSLYEVTATPGETLIFTHPDPNYVVSALCAAPTGVYFAGNIGTDFGEIRHTWIKDDGTAFVAPVVAAELINEQIYVLRSASSVLMFGTSVGFRYSVIDNLATGLDFGPAVEIGQVRDMVIDTVINSDNKLDTFAWASWQNIDSTGNSGLVKIRLTRLTEPNVAAYASDIYTAVNNTVLCVASIGDRRYFGITATGFYGGTQNPVATGVLRTGRIRYGLLESKVFSDLKWRTAPLVGSVNGTMTFDTDAMADAGTQSEAGTISNVFGSIGPVPAEWGEIAFTLTRDHTLDNHLALDGVNDTATTPDAAGFAITDLDIRTEIAPADWSPGGLGKFVIGQWPNTPGNNGWVLTTAAGGEISLTWSNDGTASISKLSTVVPDFGDATRHWIRATLDVNDGAGNNVANFYTSADGASWSQLGSTITTAGVTAIFNSTATLAIGDILPFSGSVYRVDFRASIDSATVLANPDFTRQAVGVTSFADTAAIAKTWTLNNGAAIVADSGSFDELSPELRWWVLRAIPSAEETMQFIVPLRLIEKVQGSYGPAQTVDFMDELDFLMTLSNTKQIVAYQEGIRSYSVYVNTLELNPTRWNDMDQGLEGIVLVELHTMTHL